MSTSTIITMTTTMTTTSIAAAAITMTTMMMMTMMKTSMSIITTTIMMTMTTTSIAAAAIITIIMATTPMRSSPAGASRTARKFSKADIEHALTELDTGNYGMILRSKGIVDGGADGWLEFDYVPGEWEVRARGADVGGKLVVIGSKLDEKAIAALFGC